MELVYGKGLVGLKNEHGKVDPTRFGWDSRRESQVWVTIKGLGKEGATIDGGTTQAFVYGYVEGVQYNPLENLSGKKDAALESIRESQVMSNCFYALKGVIGSVDTLIYDAKNMGKYSGQYNWFNMIFDPLHVLGDLCVAYEMCNIYEDLDKIVGILSLDWGLLAEQST